MAGKKKEKKEKLEVKISDGICPECESGKLEDGSDCPNCEGTGKV